MKCSIWPVCREVRFFFRRYLGCMPICRSARGQLAAHVVAFWRHLPVANVHLDRYVARTTSDARSRAVRNAYCNDSLQLWHGRLLFLYVLRGLTDIRQFRRFDMELSSFSLNSLPWAAGLQDIACAVSRSTIRPSRPAFGYVSMRYRSLFLARN